jgi:hypothetical protein
MIIKIYSPITLFFVLCGCETWSLTLREEHTMREFKNMMLRNTVGPKRWEVIG